MIRTSRNLPVLLSVTFIGAWLSLNFERANAAPVTIAGVPAYGYNTIDGSGNGFDGLPGAIGCGPTSAAMILSYYTATSPAPGLIGNPLTDASTMRAPGLGGAPTPNLGYMNVGPDGFGSAVQFQFGVEKFAHERGYRIDAVIHVEPTTYNPANWADYINWTGYKVGDAVAADADFWADTVNFQTIDNVKFLNFLAAEIDAGRPVGMTVDSGGVTGTDHWMVAVGYDRATNQWAGHNTFDNQLHWYNIDSAFKDGNFFGVGFVRTFNFLGPEENGSVPEPTGLLLFGTGLAIFGFLRRIGKAA